MKMKIKIRMTEDDPSVTLKIKELNYYLMVGEEVPDQISKQNLLLMNKM